MLADAGCQALPAFNCEEAIGRAREVGVDIEAAIINPSLRGVSGLLESLRKDHGGVRIIAITASGDELAPAIGAHATLQKPAGPALSREEWVRKVKIALADGHGAQLS